MARKNVVKNVVVSHADRLIEKVSTVLNLHDVCLNGDKGVSVSSFIGAIFEGVVVAKDKDAKLYSLLANHFDLKDIHGEPIEPDRLKAYIREVFDVMGR
jgi:hypothetical protein